MVKPMKIRLDTESQQHLDAIMGFVGAGQDDAQGFIWDAALTAFLSWGPRDAADEIRAEHARDVVLDGIEVPFGPTVKGDPREKMLHERAQELAAAWGVPIDERLFRAGIRIGLQRIDSYRPRYTETAEESS